MKSIRRLVEREELNRLADEVESGAHMTAHSTIDGRAHGRQILEKVTETLRRLAK